MPDYTQSKIYKLVSNKSPDIYIGSCLMRLSTRLSQHKLKSNKCSSKKLFVNEAIITIVLIENYACNSKNELKARELYHITSNVCININKPFISEIHYGDTKEYNKEYRLANSEQIKEYEKQYYQSNSDHIKERQKIYNQSHRDQRNSKQRSRYAEQKLLASLKTLSI